jgi:hypothetical protein
MLEEERERYKDEANFLQQELAASKARENSLQERLFKEVGNSHERYHDQLIHISELEVLLIIRDQIDFLGFCQGQDQKDEINNLRLVCFFFIISFHIKLKFFGKDNTFILKFV